MPPSRPRGPARRPSEPRPAGRTLADAAHARLRDSIVTLRLAPGAPLTEVEVCRRLGISRTPVRAALARLQQEGLVQTSRTGGAGRVSVALLTASDMRELFLMVGALDGVAARLAAELPDDRRRGVAHDAEAINARLRVLSATDASDIRLAQDLDVRFHRCYEQAASGPRLLAKLVALQARRERYVRVYTEALVHTHSVQESLDEHGAIIQAIADGDGEAAERHALFNYRNALARYWRIVAIHGDRSSWV
jgi:DNA-binding GntR family transcriptional regulator